jgi:hypothetical protein
MKAPPSLRFSLGSILFPSPETTLQNLDLTHTPSRRVLGVTTWIPVATIPNPPNGRGFKQLLCHESAAVDIS